MSADVRALKREISQLRNEVAGLRGRLSVATKVSQGPRRLFRWPNYNNAHLLASVRTILAMGHEATLTVDDDKDLVLNSVRRVQA